VDGAVKPTARRAPTRDWVPHPPPPPPPPLLRRRFAVCCIAVFWPFAFAFDCRIEPLALLDDSQRLVAARAA